jgi:hypothetical protein
MCGPLLRSGPDHRDVGGLADPEDLLLNFRQPLEPALHRQIAAGDHRPGTGTPHGCQQHFGKILEAPLGPDLQRHRRLALAETIAPVRPRK